VIIVVFVFHKNNEGQKGKHKDNDSKMLPSCLRGAKTRGKDDDNL